MIAQEEKIKRRNILEKNSNITDAGFGEEIDPRINNIPEVELFINGEIDFDEYQKAINNFIKEL